MAKELPVTTYSFRDIIENNHLYVDKTEIIYELCRYSKRTYFLSRPRRFGKSLLISTLEAIFSGNKELFRGLWIYDSAYEWEVYPVIHIDFGPNTVKSAVELEQLLAYFLEELAFTYQLTLRGFNYQTKFQNLIQQLAQTNQVVILIDEYDKPIIDNIENIEEAKRIRETLKAFYAVIKGMDAHLHIAFITGISKFSQVGVFSTLNNLVDLTINTQFATMLGLTEHEVRRDFAEHIQTFAEQQGQSVDEFMDQLRHWYNGFCFAPDAQNVYNPFSVVHLFYHRRFSNYWFRTGTPTFLIKLIQTRNYQITQFDHIELAEIFFDSYDLEDLSIIPLLYQTGYLTIKDARLQSSGETIFTLAYPNYEVEHAFRTYLLGAFSYIERTLSGSYLHKLVEALRAQNLATVFEIISVFFANIPYTLHIKYEQYYQSIFYTLFMLVGLEVNAEVVTNDGRIDAVIELADHILLFEFKLDKSAEEALQQIKKNQYYQKYRLHNKQMTLIGANFNSARRTVDEWVSELEQ